MTGIKNWKNNLSDFKRILLKNLRKKFPICSFCGIIQYILNCLVTA